MGYCNSSRCMSVCDEWRQCILLLFKDGTYATMQPVVNIMREPLLSWHHLITASGRRRACDAMIVPHTRSAFVLRFGTHSVTIATGGMAPNLPPFPPLPAIPMIIRGTQTIATPSTQDSVRTVLASLPPNDSLLSIWRQRQRSLLLRLTFFDHTNGNHFLSLRG
jgi:hypothetical protein